MELSAVVFTDFLLTPLCFSSFLREMLISVALGQVLSLLVCGIGLTSKYLAEDFHANTPVFQSFLNYILLFLVYTTTLAVRQGKLSKAQEYDIYKHIEEYEPCLDIILSLVASVRWFKSPNLILLFYSNTTKKMNEYITKKYTLCEFSKKSVIYALEKNTTAHNLNSF